MKPERQRIAIAEERGYRWLNDYDSSRRGWWVDGDGYLIDPPPDYLNDLNAIAQAEATLDGTAEAMAYVDNLERVIDKQNSSYAPCVGRYRLVTATAAQRAEAFLKTINKWEDE